MIRVNCWLNFSFFTNKGGLKTVKLHGVQPIRIREQNCLTFFPKDLLRSQIRTSTEPIVVSPARFAGIKKEVTVSLPQVETLEEFAVFVEATIPGELGKTAGELVRGGLALLLQADRPGALPNGLKSDLFAIAEATSRGVAFIPTSGNGSGLYFLIEETEVPKDGRKMNFILRHDGKSMSIPIFESAEVFLQALKLTDPEGPPELPVNGAAATTADGNARQQLGLKPAPVDDGITIGQLEAEEAAPRRVIPIPTPAIPDNVVNQILAVLLPATSITSGQTGNHQISTNVAAVSEIGLVRKHNEDGYVITEDGLYVVCDGMGGHASGEVASAMTLQIIFGGHTQALTLAESIGLAAEKVKQVAATDPTKKNGMGTTVAAVKRINETDVEIAHVGDSRIYYVDNNGSVGLLTQDHSLRMDLAKKILQYGPESDEVLVYKAAYQIPFDQTTPWVVELLTHFKDRPLDGILFNEDITILERILNQIPRGNIIIKAIGHSSNTPTINTYKLQPKEWLLICSDGVNGELKEHLVSLLRDHKTGGFTVAESAEAIKGAILTMTRGTDNFTFVLIEQPADIEPITTNLPIIAIQLQNPNEVELATLLNNIVNGNVEIPFGAEDHVIMALTNLMGKHQTTNLVLYNLARDAQNIVLEMVDLPS